jgi:Iap family predicted aminopeptidase
MVKTVKETTKRDAKKQRETLFRCLDAALAISHKKIYALRGSDSAKRGWARVLVSAVSTYGNLLKDEELELRVIALEEQLKNSVLIPKPEEPKSR